MDQRDHAARRRWFAIAAIGRDRPGIVADLSECIFNCNCNLEDASMTMLGTEFATLMVASGIGDDLGERIASAAKRLEWEKRLTIFVRPFDEEPRPPAGHAAQAYVVTARGMDKAGIVAGVARCLANHDIWITDLRGKLEHLPESGTPLYTLVIRVNVPATANIDEVRQALRAIAENLRVEITFDAAR